MLTTSTKPGFYNNCVNWDVRNLRTLQHLIDNGREIKRTTFLRNVNREALAEVERSLGYGSHLTMAKDYHVRYHKCGRIYFLVWSSIEYVFATEDMIQQVRRSIE